MKILGYLVSYKILMQMHKIIYELVGKELADLKVIDIKPWVMHAEVAEEFLSGGNRIILAGDAAHRFPPAGGFGRQLLSCISLSFLVGLPNFA